MKQPSTNGHAVGGLGNLQPIAVIAPDHKDADTTGVTPGANPAGVTPNGLNGATNGHNGAVHGGHEATRASLVATLPPSKPAPRELVGSVILPAFNESEALGGVLESLFSVLDARYEVIVVDDGSSDDTAEIARRFPCTLLQHKHNQGKGAAVRTGIGAARGPCMIVIDADATYPAEAIPRLVELLETHDFVRCVRVEGRVNIPLVNRAGNVFFDYVLRWLHGVDGCDQLTGLYGLRRNALDSLRLTATGFDLEAEIAIKAHAHHLSSASFGVGYRARLGKKKLRPWHDGWRILCRALELAVLYRPGLVLVAPSVLLWVLAGLIAVLGAQAPAETASTGFGSNGVIVPVLCFLAGFQCLLLGVATALLGAQLREPSRPWLSLVSGRGFRVGGMVFGAAFAAVGLAALTTAIVVPPATAFGPLGFARGLVLAGLALVCGTQAAFAAFFLSAFKTHWEGTSVPAHDHVRE